jgi:cytochrome c-type biogenesis protein CcmH/NrfF
MINGLWTELHLKKMVKVVSKGINKLISKGEIVKTATVQYGDRILYSYPPKPKRWGIIDDWAPKNE